MSQTKTLQRKTRVSKKKISQGKIRHNKITIDNITFDSDLEARYYLHLKEEKESGNIYKFELQPSYVLMDAFSKNGIKYRKMEYVADFKIYRSKDPGDFYLVDTKGFETADFKLKQKLFNYFYRDIELVLVTYDGPTKQWVTTKEHKRLVKERKKQKQNKDK